MSYNNDSGEQAKTQRIVAGVTICVSLPTIIICFAFGGWAVSIYQGWNQNQVDNVNCKNKTIVELFLALGIVDIIQGGLILFSVGVALITGIRPNSVTANMDRACSCFRTICGLTTFGLAIAMSSLVWGGSECNLNQSGIYYVASPYLIAYWAVVVSCSLLTIVFTCCAVCCGVAIVAAISN